MNRKLLIIGGVAAGSRGAARAKRADPAAEVTLLTREPHISYSACSFPYYIGRRVDRVERLILLSPGEFEKSRGVRVLARHEVLAIDRAARTLTAANLETGKSLRLEYDALLLATGASPRPLPVKGADLGRVFTLRSPDDARAIRETVELSDVRRVAVVGGGLIGVEVAENLLSHSLDEITLIHNKPALLPDLLDDGMALLIERELRRLGVRLLLDDEIVRLEARDGRNIGTVITRRERFDADIVIAAIGVVPNVALAKAAGLAIGEAGGIRVDARQRTSDPAIFAAGDCAECFHLVKRQWTLAPFGSLANRQGHVAGTNLAGGVAEFPGIVGAALTHAGRLAAGRTGLTEREARESGLDAVSLIINASPRAGWAGDASGPGERLWLQAVAERRTRRILGVQAVGAEGADKRLDVATQLLRAESTAADFRECEIAYHPLYSQAIDPLNTIGQALEKILESGIAPISPDALAARLKSAPGELILLDVRAPRDKTKTGTLPGAAHIPLDELRRRAAGELPRGQTIVPFDTSGRQAMDAALLLRELGWNHVAPLNGGVSLWRGDLI